MKNTRYLIASLIVFALALTGAQAEKSAGPKAQAIAKYDTNKNGTIDGDEVAVMQGDFAKDPKGDLSRFDKNEDGTLSTSEVTSIKAGSSGKKKEESTEKEGGKKKDKEDAKESKSK